MCHKVYTKRLSGGKLLSYVINNDHIDYDYDTYDVLNNSIIKPINDDVKILMNKDIFVYLLWNEDNKLTIYYSTIDDINESSYMKVIEIFTRLLISGDLAFFAARESKKVWLLVSLV